MGDLKSRTDLKSRADLKSRPGLDPARDAALLLQRMGFFTLGVALPVSAMVSRRAAVVLVPIGVALLVIAAILSEPERFVRALKRRSLRATALLLALLVGWGILSTTWAPRGVAGFDRVLNMLFAFVAGILAVAALPDRMRAANLNALAVGAGVATVVAAMMQVTGYGLGDAEDDVTVVVRGLATLIVFAGPLVAWLLSRGRTRGALALFGAVAAVTVLTADIVLVAALCAGSLAFALAAMSPGKVAARSAAFMGLLVVCAPLAPWIARLLVPFVTGLALTIIEALQAWGVIIAKAPIKLLTGHGFGSFNLQRFNATDMASLPSSIIVEIWHDLGVVGALAFAAALWLAVRATRVLPQIVQAGAISAYVTAFSLGLLGLAGIRAWWLMTLVAAMIVTTAVARGQARTDRPLARFVRRETSPDAKSGDPRSGTIRPTLGGRPDSEQL